MIHLLNNLFRKDRKLKYILSNFVCILMFSILYWICDLLTFKYEFFRKIFNIRVNEKQNNSIIYYLWFSLITQTTVGYEEITDNNNDTVHYKNSLNLLNVLNIAQLLSIFIITLIL
jgi:hypothetical protein